MESPMMITNFEQQYLAVRRKENRIYSDAEVLCLPNVLSSHVYAGEWKIRKRSANRLDNYLRKKNRPLNILEVGCGNGWLSFRMGQIPGSRVTGLDINLEEVTQAGRVFQGENLTFLCGEFNPANFRGEAFDCIVFAASVQYFPSLKTVLTDSLSLLARDGEVHILDTFFYPAEERQNAADRTANYYRSMGFPEMTGNYFHHTYDDLGTFKHKIVPSHLEIFNRLAGRQKHFDWIIVKA